MKNLARSERQPQNGRVHGSDCPHDDGFSLLHVFGYQERHQHRRDRECRQQGSTQRVAVGPSHRVEDLALDALHGEERNEGCQRDGGREQNGGIDLRDADIDEPDAVQKARIRGVSAAPAPADRGPPSKKLFSLLSLKNAEDIFNDDHR